MTAEIAILNRQAVALAADSAVTIGQNRAWKTANKLFSLSPTNDIGIMIYGYGDFLRYSWEIVARTFREHIGGRVFRTVSECGDEFVQYLKQGHFENDHSYNLNALVLFGEILEQVKSELGNHKTKSKYKQELIEVIQTNIEYIDTNYNKLNEQLDKKEFIRDYAEWTKGIAKEIFECTVTKELHNLINDLLYLALGSTVASSLVTGVVVAGYGREQYFPELVDYQVDGKHNRFIRVWVERHNDLNKPDATRAVVCPFAQSDMFQLFMEGITRNHLTFIHDTLIRVLNDKSKRLVENFVDDEGMKNTEISSQEKDNEKILGAFFSEFGSYVQDEMVQPVISVISTLPKEEMAAMAEALVEITTLRRKVDSDIESVGGPTDVAVISKGDGLVWIKRKHYFDIELNRDFLDRKRIKHGDEDECEGEE